MKIFSLINNLIKRNSLTAIIILIGGSSDCLERGSLSNCSLISLNKQFEIFNFSLNYPRRSPSVFNFKCGHLFVIGGCSEPGHHLANGELLKYNCSKILIENFNRKNWKLHNYENIKGFSCSAFCQIEGIGGFIFGGYDGIECLQQILKIDEKEPHNVNLLSPLPFGLKNSAALSSLDKQRIWIIGGWDGHKTEKIIMEYNIENQKIKFCHFLPYPLEGHAVATPNIINSRGIGFIIGGFDGIQLSSKILIIDLNNGKILEEACEKLLKGKENCAAFCFSPDGEKEFLAIIGGWDGYNVLSNCELFEVLPEHPWLKKEFSNKFKNLDIARNINRPAAIFINSEENN